MKNENPELYLQKIKEYLGGNFNVENTIIHIYDFSDYFEKVIPKPTQAPPIIQQYGSK